MTALKKREWSAEQLAKVERVWSELLVLWPTLDGATLSCACCSHLSSAHDRVHLTPHDTGENEHWIIEYVAVAPTFRKRGVCHRLMLTVLDQGRARGFKRAQITPYADNEASVKAYEKVGFQGSPLSLSLFTSLPASA
jgi:ribosomal protein S18 acetylase RimI-like enzyme